MEQHSKERLPNVANIEKELLGTYFKYFGLSLILALIIFLPWLNSYFFGDDWPAILRNLQFSWQEVPSWFTGLRAGAYRPMHDVFVALCWQAFELNPLGYRLVSIFLYALVAANVGLLARLLTDDGRIGALSTILFSAFATHAEPVLWFAATNELLAGLFVLVSVISFVLFRRTGNRLWLVSTGFNCLLAFVSKETAAFFPIMLLVYDALLFESTGDRKLEWRFFLPSLSIVLLGAAFLLFRVPQGSPYTTVVEFTIPRLVLNFVYYMLIGVLALPNNYAFGDSLPSWRASPGLPIVALVSSSSIIMITGWVWFRERIWLVSEQYKKALLFSLVWIIGALGPIIFLVSERSVFLSSAGIVLMFSTLFIGAWDVASKRGKWMKRAIVIVIVLSMGLNTYVLRYRSVWFGKSAEMNEAVLWQLDSQIENLAAGTQIWLVNLPDHIEYTFTFRNTFPAATKILKYDFDIKPVLDSELTDLSPQQQRDYVNQLGKAPDAIVLWYRDGKLVPE